MFGTLSFCKQIAGKATPASSRSPILGDWTSVDVHGHRPFERLFTDSSTDVHRRPLRCVVYIARSARYESSAVTPAVTPTGQIRRLKNALTRAFATPTMPGFDSPQLHD